MKTKYFDKKLYETEKNIKTVFIILITFLIRNVHRCSDKLYGSTR